MTNKPFFKVAVVCATLLTSYTLKGQTLNFNPTTHSWDAITDYPGVIHIGCQNTLDFAHITTDKGKFFFNRSLYINGAVSAYSMNNLLLQTNGLTRVHINSTNGNVGIGMSNPTYKLDVGGTFHVSGALRASSDAYLDAGARIKGDLRFFNVNSPYQENVKIGYSNDFTLGYFDFTTKLYFRNHTDPNIAPLLLQDNGTVAINVNPNYTPNVYYDTQGFKLAVNGGILCEKIRVISDVPSSDYVFSTDYKLMPLLDLKKYVEENKHLPEVPSAQEFQEEGYDVGTMDDILLRKIEELTLYILQLQKEIELLKKNQ